MAPGKKEYEPKKLADVLQRLVDQKPLKKGITTVRVVAAWESVMGKNVQAYTDHLELLDQRLIVQLRSAPLKNELLFARETIVKKLNETLGETVITELVFR